MPVTVTQPLTAEPNGPQWLHGATGGSGPNGVRLNSALAMRRVLQGIYAWPGGVLNHFIPTLPGALIGSGDLQVGTGAGSIVVNPGSAIVPGTQMSAWGSVESVQGFYQVDSITSLTLVPVRPNSGNRTDYVIIQITDAEISGADNAVVGLLQPSSGSGPPADTDSPPNSILLGAYTVSSTGSVTMGGPNSLPGDLRTLCATAPHRSVKATLGNVGPALNTDGWREVHPNLRINLTVGASGQVLVQQNAVVGLISAGFDDASLAVQVDSLGWIQTGNYAFGTSDVRQPSTGFDGINNAFRTVTGSVVISGPGVAPGPHTFYMGWARGGGGQTLWIPGDLRGGAAQGTWQQVTTL